MDKELEKRRSWPWKKKNGLSEGGSSPTPVKLFDEQVSISMCFFIPSWLFRRPLHLLQSSVIGT